MDSPTTRGTIRAATDVGGTFTDLVYFTTDPDSGAQEIVTAKSDTTPPDFERGVLNVMAKGGVSSTDVAFLAHGTTLIINALTERKGVRTALITTEGFRDSLEIARGNRPDHFNLAYRKPEPFVPRYLRREVPGRLTHDGRERRPLELDGLPEIVDGFRAEGVEAIAICLLHAYANPEHEEAVLAEVRELWPEISVVASHQITREWREYERTSTSVLSAYVQPVAERYLTRLSTGIRDGGFDGQLYIMQSNCGVDSVEKTSEIPITMVESGPASGFWGAAELGRLIGEPNVLALDIGGTTAKCSLIEGGHVKIMTDYWIGRNQTSAGYPIMVPVVDLVEIGNGGGSIAWVDDFGKLRVGPQSAGAMPGPASYGRGGTEATTTDANLALGRINKDFFCGGEIDADMAAVEDALDRIAGSLGTDRQEAARGVVRIANNNMINALKLISVNRGYDPRDFTLVAFGGGGGMHAVALATELGDAEGGHPARGRRLLCVGHADDRPPPRLLRHAAHRPARGERRTARGAPRRGDGIGARAVRGRRRRARPGAVRALREDALREPGARRRDPPAGRDDRAVEHRAARLDASTRPTSASTRTGSTRQSRSSASISSPSRRSGSWSRRGFPSPVGTSTTRRREAATWTTPPKAITEPTSTTASCSSPG